MFKRTKVQPDPMKDYILEDSNGFLFLGRWLVGKTYEGWYIKDVSSLKADIKTPFIISQKTLKVMNYYDVDDPKKKHRYISKDYLDEVYKGRDEVSYVGNV